MADETEKPKIIVDDDWKAQAQAEKQRLAEDAEKKSAAPEAGQQAEEEGHEGPHEIPPASFSSLVNTIAMQTMMALGGMEDPETKKRYVDLAVAKYHIDTLTMLQGKTEGHLTDDEKNLLDRALNDLRMGFVHIAQHIQKAQAEEKNK